MTKYRFNYRTGALALMGPLLLAAACGATESGEELLEEPAPATSVARRVRVPRPKPVVEDPSGFAGTPGAAGSGPDEVPYVEEDPCGETPVNDCATAVDLGGEIRGDSGSDVRSMKDYRSQWFRLNVKEDQKNSGASFLGYLAPGVKLRIGAYLISPRDANYDMYLYHDCHGSERVASEEAATTTDLAMDSWGEGGNDNQKDDGKTIYIKVLHKGGECDAAKTYSLQVTGNVESKCDIDVLGWFCN